MKSEKIVLRLLMPINIIKYNKSFQQIKVLSTILLILSLNFSGVAQKVYIKLGNTNIALNEAFTISITLENEQLNNYSSFPEIPGFQKIGTSSQSSTNYINGQMSSSQSIIQNYRPTKVGKFNIPIFKIKINGSTTADCNGGTIVVGAPRQQRQQDPADWDPFEDFFSGNRNTPKEFVEVKEDAFFALTSSKDQVYVGEGSTITLAFYVAKNNQAEMQFYDLGKQLGEILKKIKPDNCWEENFNIEEIQSEQVIIKGKAYDEYKLYRGAFYPLKNEPITIPSVGLKMIKYKVSKNPSFFNNSRQEDFKTFYTTPKIIKVKDLPKHPLKGQVAVGDYKLIEKTPVKAIVTGKSFNYSFEIEGEGNITAINAPTILNNPKIEIYPPNIRQDINRSNISVTGKKSFNYFVIPKEPGKSSMKEVLQWIFFNPIKAKYDTLQPKFSFMVKGESVKNKSISHSGKSDILEMIDEVSDKKISIDDYSRYILWINYGILFLLAMTLLIILKK